MALIVASAGLLVLLVLRAGAPVPWWTVVPVVVVATASGAVLSASRPLDTSPGAVDNATGVIAALVAAEQLRDRGDIGILITDAEELGLEGARAWAGGLTRSGRFVNFDALDDRGAFRVVRHDRPAAAQGLAVEGIAQECSRLLRARGEVVVEKRLPPGVMVDGSALARVGMAGVTLSRGDWQTLAVLHTPGDVASRVSLASAVAAGEVAALAAKRLSS
jgi:Zn-dependent M28 family amino/carboxypeptidase